MEIRQLSCGQGGQGPRLHEVSLTLGHGEVCCLLGPNGAGKTTLLRCLLRLLPAAGTVRICGQDIRALSARQLARLLAYVPQSTAMPFPFSALEIAVTGRTPHIAFGASASDEDREIAHGHLERLGIGHLAGRLFPTLSGGERQLVLLARALVQEAPVLVLDEPTAALDYGNEVRILQQVSSLAREGRSILMTTHQPGHALSCARRAVLMRDGAVVADGPPAEVITGAHLSRLYGVPIHVGAVMLPGSSGREVRVCVPIPAT